MSEFGVILKKGIVAVLVLMTVLVGNVDARGTGPYICHAIGNSGKYSLEYPATADDILGHYNEKWDIIPPFRVDGVSYEKNWDADGQAVHANGCEAPEVTPVPTQPPVTPEPTEEPVTPEPTEVPTTPIPTEPPVETPEPTEVPATPTPTEVPATPEPSPEPPIIELPETGVGFIDEHNNLILLITLFAVIAAIGGGLVRRRGLR